MTAAYFVNKKEKLLMLIMSTGKKMPWLREENRRAQQEHHLKELSEIMQ